MTITDDTVLLNGQKVCPWVKHMTFDQNSCPKEVCYKYSIFNKSRNETVWERISSRHLKIQDPHSKPYDIYSRNTN